VTESPKPLKLSWIATTDPNALTLRVAGDDNILTKRIDASGNEASYDNAFRYIACPADVSSTRKIVALAKELGPRDNFAITYGAIAAHVGPTDEVLRRSQKIHGPAAAFYPVPRFVYLLDVDAIMPPTWLDPRDLEAAVRYVRLQLPEAFHDVEMVFVASSGYLRKSGLRFRVWVRISRPLTPQQFKRWMEIVNAPVDKHPLQTVGVNYTASPIFEDPSMDPLPNGRIVVLAGKPCAQAPDDQALFQPEGRRAKAKKRPREPAESESPRNGRVVAPVGKSRAKTSNDQVLPQPEGRTRRVRRKPAESESRDDEEEGGGEEIDRSYAHLWDDDDAVFAASGYLSVAPIGVRGGNGRHPTALKVFMRLLDFGCTPAMARRLMWERWARQCVPPYDDLAELDREVAGLERARENPIGYRHPAVAFTPTAKKPDGPIEPPEDAPPVELVFQTRAEAEARLREVATSIFGEFFDLDPLGDPNKLPTYGIPAGVGLGKTEEALKLIYAGLRVIRGRRGKGTIKARRRAVVLAVPTHRLSGELEKRFNEIVEKAVRCQQQRAIDAGMSPRVVEHIGRRLRLQAATWRGREANVPGETGNNDEKMCRNLDAVRAAQQLQQDVEGKVCKACEFKSDCAYLAQYAKRGDLWIVAHASLFSSMPRHFPAAGVEFVIIDESVDKAALRGIDVNARIELMLEDLVEGATPFPPHVKMSVHSIKRLEALRGAVWSALCKSKPPSPVIAANLRKQGITAYDAAWAAAAERRRIYRGEDPGLLELNRNVAAMSRMWSTIADLLQEDGPEVSGRLTVIKDPKTKIRKLMITGYDKIHADYRRPILLIDASLDAQRARPLFQNINVVNFLPVEMPHVTIKKSIGRSCGKSMLLPIRPANGVKLTNEEGAENLTRANNRAALRANLINLARSHRGKKLLVVSYKELIELLDLPPTIATAHFNALAGRDQWADYDIAVIVGRPLPPPGAVEAISGAVTGVQPVVVERWYHKRPAQHIVRRGGGFVAVPAEKDRHPDDMADRHLRRICEMEIEQAIGRLRGVRRTANNPATVIVLNDVVLDMPVDELFAADLFFSATPQERMMAEGGIAFESPADAVRAYPRMWPSVEAAKKALQRSKSSGTFSYKDSLIGKCPRASVKYRKPGNGQRTAQCLADLAVVPNPKAKLEELLGPLALFVMVTETTERPATVRCSQELETGSFTTVPALADLDLIPRAYAPGDLSDRLLAGLAALMGYLRSKALNWIGARARGS
jgi:hypothetical protein